jgi:hypothetical protein
MSAETPNETSQKSERPRSPEEDARIEQNDTVEDLAKAAAIARLEQLILEERIEREARELRGAAEAARQAVKDRREHEKGVLEEKSHAIQGSREA